MQQDKLFFSAVIFSVLNLAEFDQSAQFKIKNSDIPNICSLFFCNGTRSQIWTDFITSLLCFWKEHSSLKKLFPAQAVIPSFKLTF